MFPHRPPENKLFTLLLPVILLRAVKKKEQQNKTNKRQTKGNRPGNGSEQGCGAPLFEICTLSV